MGMSSSIRKVSMSDFHCSECNFKIVLPRKKNLQRKKDHIKHIYCIKCKVVVAHKEVRFCDFGLAKEA